MDEKQFRTSLNGISRKLAVLKMRSQCPAERGQRRNSLYLRVQRMADPTAASHAARRGRPPQLDSEGGEEQTHLFGCRDAASFLKAALQALPEAFPAAQRPDADAARAARPSGGASSRAAARHGEARDGGTAAAAGVDGPTHAADGAGVAKTPKASASANATAYSSAAGAAAYTAVTRHECDCCGAKMLTDGTLAEGRNSSLAPKFFEHMNGTHCSVCVFFRCATSPLALLAALIADCCLHARARAPQRSRVHDGHAPSRRATRQVCALWRKEAEQRRYLARPRGPARIGR